MSIYIGPKVIINNAFCGKKAQSFLEFNALRDFCNILYEKMTGKNRSGISYKYIQLQVSGSDIKNFFETDNHFIEGISKVICTEEVTEETVQKINSIYPAEIQEILKEAREAFAALL